MKGIILAGGAGSRLHPATLGISKQLLPVYDKPMVYYPLSTLMLAGIREILVISTPHDLPLFRRLLGDGSQFGIELSYAEQDRPRGLADAFVVGKSFIGGDSVALVLGDNIFHGEGLADILQAEAARLEGCTLFGYRVRRSRALRRRRGGRRRTHRRHRGEALPAALEPGRDRSLLLRQLDRRDRGEPRALGARRDRDHRRQQRLRERRHARAWSSSAAGMAWLDTGTHDSLLEASQFIHVLQHRQDLRIACLEEVAFRMGYIDVAALAPLAAALGKSSYGEYVATLSRETAATP